jgi:hypothetical protein
MNLGDADTKHVPAYRSMHSSLDPDQAPPQPWLSLLRPQAACRGSRAPDRRLLVVSDRRDRIGQRGGRFGCACQPLRARSPRSRASPSRLARSRPAGRRLGIGQCANLCATGQVVMPCIRPSTAADLMHVLPAPVVLTARDLAMLGCASCRGCRGLRASQDSAVAAGVRRARRMRSSDMVTSVVARDRTTDGPRS